MRFDSDQDGVVTFKDFYDHMLRKVPQEWLQWIHKKYLSLINPCSVRQGVREEYIRMSLEMNGIEPTLAADLVARTKHYGLLKIGSSFADNGKSYIYTVKS